MLFWLFFVNSMALFKIKKGKFGTFNLGQQLFLVMFNIIHDNLCYCVLSPCTQNSNICLYVKLYVYMFVFYFVFSAFLLGIGLNLTNMHLFWLCICSIVY